MNITSRSYLTAGIAALGAGAIALTPVQPIPNHLAMAPERVVSNLSVDLAAAIDPITPWVDAINAAVDNAYALQDTWNDNPFPIIQTIVQNQFTYLSELPNIGLIFQQITGNIGNFLKAPFGTDADNVNNTVPVTNRIPVLAPDGFTQRQIFGLLPAVLGVETYQQLEPLLLQLTTPLSGFLLGFAGPGLSSMLQLQETVQNIFNPAPGAKPLLNAINEILNLPANLFNAAFNGGKNLDLTPLVGSLLPEGTKLGIRTGGFLNGGGVAFDGVTAEVTSPLPLTDSGISVGFIGATGSLANYVADAIKVVPPAPTASIAAAAAAPAAEATDAEAKAPAVVAASSPTEETAPAPAEDAAPAPAAEATAAVDEAPAPKRKTRAEHRADKAGNSAHANRTGRAARNSS